MKRFGYWRDPLCLLAVVLYALNRWLIAPHTHTSFLHGYFDDFLLIPAALPFVLWLQHQLGLRPDDHYPTPGEILFHLGIWSLICEVLGPHLFPHAVGDPLDVLAYTCGALVAWVGWKQSAPIPTPAT